MSTLRVLVGTKKGAFILTADGTRKNWSITGPHFAGWEIYHLKGSPLDPNRIYASQTSGWFGQIIQRSDDGGKTWRSVSLSGEVDFHALETRGKIFYGVNSGNGKLLHSQDGGKSWKDLGGMKYEDFAIANPKKNQIYLTRDGKLFRGNDGLNTVSEIKGIAGVRAVEVRGSELFVAAGKSLMLSTSSGRSWEKRAAFTSEIADFSVSSNLVVVVAGNQIFTSTDGGKSFR